MKRYLRIAITVGLTLSLAACLQTQQQEASDNQPQSAMAVKDTTQTLDLKPLSGQISVDVNRTVVEAFQRKQSHVWVEGAGEVVKLLPDDNQGARHQKFLVRINATQTLLFAHNIDLAPGVTDLKVGDDIAFRGEYVFNPKGGVVHWTHRDPRGQQEGGWIKHQGKSYE